MELQCNWVVYQSEYIEIIKETTRIIYATMLLILTLFQRRDIIMKSDIDITRYNIGIIENEEDDDTVAIRLSTEYAKIT